ncbi:MAG: HAMP domain-containing sensor histidine kinase [Pelobium sp.]
MKRRSISLIIGLMSFALAGVMAMQYYFIQESYTLKSQLFDQSVNDVLNNVSEKLEKKEAMFFLTRKAEANNQIVETGKNSLNKKKYVPRKNQVAKNNSGLTKQERQTIAFVRRMKANQAKSDSIFRLRDSLVKSKYPYQLVYNGPAPEDPNSPVNINFKVDVEEITDEFGVTHGIIRQSLVEGQPLPVLRTSNRGFAVVDTVKRYMVLDPKLGTVMKTVAKANFMTGITAKELSLASQKFHAVNDAKKVKIFVDSIEKTGDKNNILMDVASEMQQVNIPLKNRIQPQTIDSLLALELANHGIDLDYNYKITSSIEDSVIFIKASTLQNTFVPSNTYKKVLFPKDMIRDGGFLEVNFPQKGNLILKNMDSILMSSAGLLLILAGSFAYTILSILRQKKVSEMKNDFINNMTHEFKTPVATIMIASEALRDPEINDNKARVNKLANIIYDENVRLGNHIERVLNIAKIEKDDLKLESEKLNMNELIANVVDSMSLQLQKKNAILIQDLKASKNQVIGDELHLSNVIFNLLDNAIKYSVEHPEISISTENQGHQIVIKVADNGIGMNRDQQKKIFEQFYRIPTGNLHDVKGFGLGLSYVSNMVKRMNGSIEVRSEKDKGAEFELKFPIS